MVYEKESNKWTNKTNKQAKTQTHTDNSVVVTREKVGWGAVEGRKGHTYGDERRSDYGWWRAKRHADEVTEWILETNIIILTDVTPINLMKKYNNKKRKKLSPSSTMWSRYSKLHGPKADDTAPDSRHISPFKIPSSPPFLHKNILCLLRITRAANT